MSDGIGNHFKDHQLRLGRLATIAFGCFLGVSVPGCHGGGIDRPVRSPALAELDEVVRSGLEQKLFPGAVLIVGRGERILWAQAYGRHTYDPGSPAVTLDTLWDLASVSKLAGTTMATLINLEDGRLGLDDPVSRFIPQFQVEDKRGIRIRDLLTHTSGFAAYENKDAVEARRRPEESPADALIRHYALMPLAAPPGTAYRYSCLNFQILARVNENAAGRSMEALLVERVYRPLGMKDTGYRLSEVRRARTAPTHRSACGDLCRGETHDPLARYHGAGEHCPGNAGLFSTGPELAAFCRMVLDGGTGRGRRILRPETLALATARQTPADWDAVHGLGFALYTRMPYATPLHQHDGARAVGHFGYTGTWVWMDQRTGLYWVFLTNRTFPASAEDLEATPDIAPVRRAVAETVLRSIPDYAPFFSAGATQPAAGRLNQ